MIQARTTGFRYGSVAFFLATIFQPVPLLHAAYNGESIDDTGLSDPSAAVHEDVPTLLGPDRVESEAGDGRTLIEVLREDHGRLTPVVGLPLSVSFEDGASAVTDFAGQAHLGGCTSSDRITGSAGLSDSYVRVGNDSAVYSIGFDAPCNQHTRLIFKSDSNGGQALGIWQIAQKAKTKLEASVGLGFWRSPMAFIWPADADYYSWGTVHISRGDHWDVIGHEMGHAIYDQAGIGEFGGGQHRIDECYSKALALSEGWASFFAAWVSVDLADADAKFEFMVPRRAPIRFEAIPADVCKGSSNEWRVTGFYWDLIDTHEDGEAMQESFARVWNALAGSGASSADDTLESLVRAGFQSDTVHGVWNLNF